MTDIGCYFRWDGLGYRFFLKVLPSESLQAHNLRIKYFPGYFGQYANDIITADDKPMTFAEFKDWCRTLPVPQVKTISKYNFIARAIHTWKNRY